MGTWSIRFCIFFIGAAALLAQHESNPFDAQIGARIYLNNCVYCHGPDGDQVPGIKLGSGKFKHATTDAEITDIIRKGIPGTGMPAQTNMPPQQVRYVVAYLRSLAAEPPSDLPPGDASRGKAIFEGKGGCLNCHRVRESGAWVGPDLSDIGSVRRVAEMEKTLLDPAGTLLPQNRSFRAVTRDGNAVTGRILNQDTFTLQLIDARGRLLSLQKSDLREVKSVDSPMPSYKDKLSRPELADLIAYMVTLKGAR
ncbi:MAG TPA: c-type cytochrome [Bryobacteraceae bacterium]|nr:c-type cytochrome [Bryobacteraceae bacterium]